MIILHLCLRGSASHWWTFELGLKLPLELDVLFLQTMGHGCRTWIVDGILASNLVHLIPWQGTMLLIQHASQLLEKRHGFLAIHGRFMREGIFMSNSDQKIP
jgi:hypothetical protein